MRRFLERAVVGFVLAVTLATTTPANAQSLRLIANSATSSVVAVQPDWPTPFDAGQVLYVQRSMNPNTVVYAARFNDDGSIDPDNPIVAYWRRYNNDGSARALSYVEDRFAYGVRARQLSGGRYDVRIQALPDIALTLEAADTPTGARLILEEGGRTLTLIYAYLQLEEGGLLPSVSEMVLVGRDETDGTVRRLTYAVSDQ